jgi:hypothetical protein
MEKPGLSVVKARDGDHGSELLRTQVEIDRLAD